MLIDQAGLRRGRSRSTPYLRRPKPPRCTPSRVQHYYAIASKATLVKPADLPVPAAKFEEAFGLPWADALSQGRVFNALGEEGAGGQV